MEMSNRVLLYTASQIVKRLANSRLPDVKDRRRHYQFLVHQLRREAPKGIRWR